MSDINQLIRETPKEILLAVIERCDDGYGIFDPRAFLDLGLPPKIVADVFELHESDHSSPKSTISTPEGYPVEALQGVHGLALLQLIAGAFDIHSPFMGRGRSARFYQEELKKVLQ